MASDDELPLPIRLQPLVAGRLHTAVLQGELKPGRGLHQRLLAKELHTSPIPVRAALSDLDGFSALRDQERSQRQQRGLVYCISKEGSDRAHCVACQATLSPYNLQV
jgi:hypothetical protein